MVNWNSIIENWLSANDENGTLHAIRLPGKSGEQIASFEASLGFEFPEQMRDLYLTSNGFDLGKEAESEPQFVKPLEALAAYVDQERGHLSDTHPSFASRYLPFIDFGNGDSCGYIWASDEKSRTPILVMVAHENYEYDSSQEVEEFVLRMPENLAELFI